MDKEADEHQYYREQAWDEEQARIASESAAAIADAEAKEHEADKRIDELVEEPRPPHCVCCEYMRVCDKDRDSGQKVDYCPDENYRKWFYQEANNE